MPISAMATRQSTKLVGAGKEDGADDREDHEGGKRPARSEPVERPADRELRQRERGEPDRRNRAEIGRVRPMSRLSSPATMARKAR